jgi:hypothetical protein
MAVTDSDGDDPVQPVIFRGVGLKRAAQAEVIARLAMIRRLHHPKGPVAQHLNQFGERVRMLPYRTAMLLKL